MQEEVDANENQIANLESDKEALEGEVEGWKSAYKKLHDKYDKAVGDGTTDNSDITINVYFQNHALSEPEHFKLSYAGKVSIDKLRGDFYSKNLVWLQNHLWKVDELQFRSMSDVGPEDLPMNSGDLLSDDHVIDCSADLELKLCPVDDKDESEEEAAEEAAKEDAKYLEVFGEEAGGGRRSR